MLDCLSFSAFKREHFLCETLSLFRYQTQFTAILANFSP